jgi:RNA polymerase II subunit A C-terminal domain phosphatase SSU72
MDPRRARDPRLARADPRLQRPTAEPTPPPDAYRAISTNAPSLPPSATPVQQDVVPTSTGTETSHNNSGFKARPVFCVVCASNNVSIFGALVFTVSKSHYRIDLWKVTTY